ncbi:MAG TPA: VacJ family lipoprotein [Aquabacterium sp.]|uniref:MlaA family lipoprotein n=1 Tax=Aquabacterium sp. TaxID=1872578 RepID=UPI002E32411D|nr:VacJ family lipoprotein [Aquabacterium sp.]HEX5372666.1 VacJ family lipoprotein [Aquabacterium sp.]
MSGEQGTSRPGLALASVALGAAMLLQGCATPQNRDPLESFNRKVFGFNEALDGAVIKPAAKGYATVVPEPVQTGVGNFINNLKDVWSAVNLLLQGQGAGAAEEVLRVGINTTLGMAGFVDVATSMRLDRHNEDLGQTLGVWGVPDGAYLVLPFFGPSTVRDTFALPADMYVSPSRLFREVRDVNGARVVQVLNTRAQLLSATDLMADVALDNYAFVRDAYLQRRRTMIYNGEPPEEQGLWSPEIAPVAVLWQTDLALNDPLDQVLAVPASPVDRSGPWARTSTTVASLLQAGALVSTRPVPMGDVLVHVIAPTAEELAGLRATEDVR